MRLAGIKVYSREEEVKSLGIIPVLYVHHNIIIGTSGTTNIYTYNISIDLQERATIKRNNQLVDLVSVWHQGILGGNDTKEGTLKGINESFNRLTDKFLNDYLAVNPKK